VSCEVLNVLVVISERHRKAIHLDAETLFEELLGTDDLVLNPFFIIGPGELLFASFAVLNDHYRVPFAQILVRRRMRLNIDAVVAHIRELFPRDCFSSAQRAAAHTFSIDEQRHRITVLFHNRPRYFILRFPTVIERNDSGTRRYVFFAPFPSEQILHRDHRDTFVFYFLHPRFERSRRNLRARIPDLVAQPMVTKNKDLSSLIDDWLLDLGSRRHYRSSCRGSCSRGCASRGLRLVGNGLL